MLIAISDCAATKWFRSDRNTIHVRDLNFLLWSEIFIHFDCQLHASHLILGCTPIYTSFQGPSQALTVSSPLLSYLDIRLCGFLPPGLTPDEAQRLGPWQFSVGSLLPVRDDSTDTIFHSRAEHIPVEEPKEGARAVEQVEVESVDSFSEGTEPKDFNTEMVVRRKMTIDQFLPSGRQTPS